MSLSDLKFIRVQIQTFVLVKTHNVLGHNQPNLVYQLEAYNLKVKKNKKILTF